MIRIIPIFVARQFCIQIFTLLSRAKIGTAYLVHLVQIKSSLIYLNSNYRLNQNWKISHLMDYIWMGFCISALGNKYNHRWFSKNFENNIAKCVFLLSQPWLPRKNHSLLHTIQFFISENLLSWFQLPPYFDII